jgi:FkbM family methyltransferase
MSLVQKIIRQGHVPFYAAKLLGETLRAWGGRKWLRFWCSRQKNVLLTMHTLKFWVRGSSIKTKMTDTFAVMESLYHNIYNRRFYSDEFRIEPGDTVVDIGGYVGSFALPAAQFARGGRVFSLEPEPENFVQLEKNVRLNKLDNIKAINLAVASTDRKVLLFLNPMNPASNSIYLKGDRQVEMKAISLATLFSREGIDRCDFLKVDCEGAEYEILLTLEWSLLARIGKIACEYHEPVFYGVPDPSHTPARLARHLEGRGFTVYRRPVNPYLGMLYAMNRSFSKGAASG